MKALLLIIGFVSTLAFSGLAFATAVREIEIHTEKVGEAVHWMPEKVEVAPGESVKFVVKHDLEGGFDFHGFTLKNTKIAKQVNRHKPETITWTVPTNLKAGEYPITCQFHPKHVPATLVVKSK